MLRTEACEVASNSSSSLPEVLAERRPRRWFSSRILVCQPSFKITAGLISSSFSKVTRLWVEALSEVIPSWMLPIASF